MTFHTIALRLGIACVAVVPALAQTPAPKIAFEVATIHVSNTTTADIMAGTPIGVQVQGNRVNFGWMTLKSLVAQAYDVKPPLVIASEDRQNGPRFDIVASMPEGSTRENYPAMLKSLLEERFSLKAHREQREMVAAVLTVSKNGHKLKPESAATPKSRKVAMTREVSRIELTDDWDAFRSYMFTAAYPDTPFLDQTGLHGMFTGVVELVRTPEFFAPNENGGYPALFKNMGIDAAERLGFKVSEQKMPLEVLVVDHVNPQPSEN